MEAKMGQTITLSVRTDKALKDKVGRILHQLGLNHSTAINMYYRLILVQTLLATKKGNSQEVPLLI
jgi:antitoxin component of RelBE/YafQ-DinJ toxin-antitoxin module